MKKHYLFFAWLLSVQMSINNFLFLSYSHVLKKTFQKRDPKGSGSRKIMSL